MDYRQTEGAATTWRRAHQIIINNQRGNQPSIIFHEEDVVTLGDKTFSAPGMSAVMGLFDPAEVVPLINPLTGESLGATATHQDLYVLLYSVYIQQANARDVAATLPPETI